MAAGWGRRMRVEMVKYATDQSATASATVKPTYVALTTSNPGDDGQTNAAGAVEPTSTGGYARQTIAFAAVTTPSNDAAALTKHAAISFGASSAAWSTGASTLGFVALYASQTLFTEAVFCGRATITTPPAVASAGITLTIAQDAIQMGLISV